MTTPSPWSTSAHGVSPVSSRLVPRPPSSVPPAGRIGASSSAMPTGQGHRLLGQAGAVGDEDQADHPRRPQRVGHEGHRGRARVLVAYAAFAQVAGAALAGAHLRGGSGAVEGGLRRRVETPSGPVRPEPSASIIVLSPSAAEPSFVIAARASAKASARASSDTSVASPIARPRVRNIVPYRGPEAPPTLRIKRRSRGDQHLRRSGGRGGDQGLLHGGEATVEVGAVVGVADSAVEVGQVVAVGADAFGDGRDPAQEEGRVHQRPHRRPGVSTGWSQSVVSSRSSRQVVMEKPAMSRLVT